MEYNPKLQLMGTPGTEERAGIWKRGKMVMGSKPDLRTTRTRRFHSTERISLIGGILLSIAQPAYAETFEFSCTRIDVSRPAEVLYIVDTSAGTVSDASGKVEYRSTIHSVKSLRSLTSLGDRVKQTLSMTQTKGQKSPTDLHKLSASPLKALRQWIAPTDPAAP